LGLHVIGGVEENAAMKADALTPRDLFEGKVQFEIPSFQRPYVWSEEDQWAPLWADIKRVAIAVVEADGDPEALERVGAHFLGAVVLKELSHHAGDVARSAVIDGQQRMTTLQIVLDAAHSVVDELEYEDEAEFLSHLIVNTAKSSAEPRSGSSCGRRGRTVPRSRPRWTTECCPSANTGSVRRTLSSAAR
jgi:uncharacterized protein with ParB-like and HNH nuclease domain